MQCYSYRPVPVTMSTFFNQVNPDNLGQLDAGNSDAMMILSSRVGLIIGKGLHTYVGTMYTHTHFLYVNVDKHRYICTYDNSLS